MQTGHFPPDPQADRRASYAASYAEAGDHGAAADLMRQALDLVPGWAGGWLTLADYLEKAGSRQEAMAALSRAADLDPDGALGARARLAAFGTGLTPDTLPPAFVRGLFDQYADRFETQLRERLAYQAPERLLEALDAGGAARFGQALDLGCGTGLMGALLRPRADRLTGIDLSPRMIAKARAKGVYDHLHEADILGFEAPRAVFDLVAAADVLNYIGDLAPVFGRVRRWLRPDGLFAFTVEAHDGGADFALRETMRYAHSGTALAGLLGQAGLTVLSQSPVRLREDRGAPVEGWIFVARARGDQASS